MDYEKAYKDALERARVLMEEGRVAVEKGTTTCEYIFPELKMSDDEKIRKEIIVYLDKKITLSNFGGDIAILKKWISWLEKQCEQPNKVSLWKHWKNGIAGNGKGKLIYLVKIGNTYNLCSCLSFECDYIELSELDNMWNWKTNRAMKTISNKQKAFEIANKDRSIELLTQWNKPSYYDGLLQGAMEAMEWKDEQHEQDKQQWIDKLEDWLDNNICNAYNFRGDDISSTFINDCIKAMKGE